MSNSKSFRLHRFWDETVLFKIDKLTYLSSKWVSLKMLMPSQCLATFITTTVRLLPAVYIWATPWENVSSGVSDQVGLKLACSATEASMRLEIVVTETRDITLSIQRKTNALIRLRGCADWSAPLLFAYSIRHVFSWPGSYGCDCVHRSFTLPCDSLSIKLR